MKKILITCLISLFALPAFAQGVLNVRINEVMVANHDDVVDGYGHHSSWIELFNTGYEQVNIGGCWLAVRYANRYDENGQKLVKKYLIPRSDPSTTMRSLEYRLFYCEGSGTKGTYYTNFTLENANVDMIYLYNGTELEVKDIISVFRFPSDYQPVPDVSLGLIGHYEPESYIFPDITREQRAGWESAGVPAYGDEVLDYLAANLKYEPQELRRSTPGATNEQPLDISRDEVFRRNDPSGLTMTLTAMGVVFLALVILCWVFKSVGKIMVSRTTRNEAVSKGVPTEVSRAKTSGSGEEIAAIALALQMLREDLHVNEATVITLNSVGRIYSPWSSKIHGLTRMPERK